MSRPLFDYLIIALVVFGPKRLPELGRSLGRGIREVRGSVSGDRHDEPEPPEAIEPPKPPAEKGTEGETVARGVVAYDAAELAAMIGLSTRDLPPELRRPAVHADDLVAL